MVKYLLFLPVLFLLAAPAPAQDSLVTVEDCGTYYLVVVDFNVNSDHNAVGKAMGQKILQAVTDYEQLVDSYLAQRSGSQSTYDQWLDNMRDIRPSLEADYAAEIEGMASLLSGDTANVRGDGLLSRDEIYLLNLLPDCGRSYQCAGLSVYGSRSQSGRPMTARLLDWNSGSQLPQIQSVTTLRHGSSSVCLIGYLGFSGVITGFNRSGVFAGILDSPTGAAYSSAGKRSYPMDLRYALEQYGSIDSVAAFMADPSRDYAYNHLVLLSDSLGSGVLENNFSGSGANIHRALRRDTSALNPGVEWEYAGAVAAVNSFILLGNVDYHTPVSQNRGRWASFRSQMALCGDTVSWEELEQVAGYDCGDGPGYDTSDIYNAGNQQVVCFRPDSMVLDCAFRQKDGSLPEDPVFERIPVSFDSPAGIEGFPVTVMSRLHLSVSPNPFRRSFAVRYGRSRPGESLFSLYDVSGRLAARMTVRYDRPGEKMISWSLGALPSGLYFLHITGDGSPVTCRLVKVR